ncbi:MAG: YcjX family protein [Opitutales bacterium]
MLLNPAHWLPRERKIAITGIAGGGKTVFLTSLLSHLAEHDPDHFVFGQHARARDFRELAFRAGYGGPFRLERARDNLSRRQSWPAKTRDCSHFRCEFRRSDQRFSRQRLHFFDLPGERIADAAIAACESYAEWSDHTIKHLEDRSSYADAAGDYLALQKFKELDEELLLRTYRETLAKLILGFKPLVAPSTFLLDPLGDTPKGQTIEELAGERLSGLEPEGGNPGEFAPMAARARKRFPELATRMTRAYRRYRRELALPVFGELREAERLIVLVDIPSLLLGGDGRYNDNRQMLDDLFEALRPGSLLGARLLGLLGIKLWPLERVAFVASKADMVLPEDVENGRLVGLLRGMADRSRHKIPGVRCEWFAASACVSTRSGHESNTLIGRPGHQPADAAELEFEVSRLPETWPRAWEPGEYAFYRVHPNAPRNLQIPPPHLGLDRVFDFIAG